MSNRLVKKIICEATSGKSITELAEQAIDASLSDQLFDTLDFAQAKKQYYQNVADYLSHHLSVPHDSVGSYVTSEMKEQFESAFEQIARDKGLTAQDRNDDSQDQDNTTLLNES